LLSEGALVPLDIVPDGQLGVLGVEDQVSQFIHISLSSKNSCSYFERECATFHGIGKYLG
jgi:hypothetical protein